jgi:hypothetical protein
MPKRPIFPIVTGFVNVLLAYRKIARPFAFDPYANASQHLGCSEEIVLVIPNNPHIQRVALEAIVDIAHFKIHIPKNLIANILYHYAPRPAV